MSAGDEKELIGRSKRGDTLAFGQLALIYRSHVRGVLHRLGVGNQLDDREQEVFLAAWKGMKRFREESSFKTWLHHIAINEARRAMRKQKISRQELEDIGHAESSLPGPHQRLCSQENSRRIQEAVGSLTPKLRIVFLLRYVEDMSSEQIAIILRLPPGTVRSRLHFSRQHLAKILEEEVTE